MKKPNFPASRDSDRLKGAILCELKLGRAQTAGVGVGGSESVPDLAQTLLRLGPDSLRKSWLHRLSVTLFCLFIIVDFCDSLKSG